MRINDVFTSLRSIFIEWDGLLINNRFIRSREKILWENYQEIDFVDVINASYVQNLIKNRQYSFQMRDDESIFQLLYRFNERKDRIIEAHLAFYYSGISFPSDDGEDYQFLNDNDPVGWLRVDYDQSPTADGGVLHSKCHLHLASFPNARLVVNRIPNPKQFVEFIIASCYPQKYKDKRLNVDGLYNDEAKMCSINAPLAHEIGLNNICDYSFFLSIPTKITPPVHPLPAKRRRN